MIVLYIPSLGCPTVCAARAEGICASDSCRVLVQIINKTGINICEAKTGGYINKSVHSWSQISADAKAAAAAGFAAVGAGQRAIRVDGGRLCGRWKGGRVWQAPMVTGGATMGVKTMGFETGQGIRMFRNEWQISR